MSVYDVAIVGGGPAGLTAAMWLGRYMRRVVLVDSGDPRNWQTRGINGYLGLPAVTPVELRGAGRDEARRWGAELIDGCVESITRVSAEHFQLTLESGDILESRRTLLAFGVKDIWPDIPGLERIYGATAYHCPDCDGHETRGKKTVVVGVGRKAVGLALALATWTRELVICTNGQDPELTEPLLAQLDTLNIPVLTTRVTCALHKDRALQALELENGMSLDCERLFFSIGRYAADDLAQRLGCERNEEGCVTIDEHHHTSVANVYAAGDLVPGTQIALAAAAGGAIAAIAIHHSLLAPEFRITPPAQNITTL
ncbi:MAG TPA: NAD(P)/FAD-dependent oxidoreductase [Gemmatimonadaceae bacterium]|nr:NAD(P)/FAD-dependent oxidoreductase [Gemmatimonadaceae bacterium]